MQSALEIAESLLWRWRDDPAGCMATLVAPDVVYTLNVSPDALVLGGETRGWDAVNEKMLGIRKVFEYLVFRPLVFATRGDVVRARIEFVLRHRNSGQLLSGQMRSVFTVRDGLVVRVDEYVDAPLIESFMRMFADGE
jgi:ketosteroid isomerase-like protein